MAAPHVENFIRLLLIGDRGVGKTCLFSRFYDGSFRPNLLTIGVEFKGRTIELDQKRVRLQIWDTAGYHHQEQLQMITSNAFYRGPSYSGFLLVYDVTDKSSFNNIRKRIRDIEVIEQHASDKVKKILVGNKADMHENARAVSTLRGQELADEYGIRFFETSALTNMNVEDAFFSIARDIKQRLDDI